MVKVPRKVTIAEAETVNLRCPACLKLGAFGSIGDEFRDATFGEVVKDVTGKRIRQWFLGVRRCPNLECAEAVFVVRADKHLVTYPAERLDFEPAGVPAEIVASFEEAITAHSHRCYKAAAIMVRRTLEEICSDRNATGANLKQRIAALGKNTYPAS